MGDWVDENRHLVARSDLERRTDRGIGEEFSVPCGIDDKAGEPQFDDRSLGLARAFLAGKGVDDAKAGQRRVVRERLASQSLASRKAESGTVPSRPNRLSIVAVTIASDTPAASNSSTNA